MLSHEKYELGLSVAERMKYCIVHDKETMFNIVCAGLASKILESDYAGDLTDKQRETLLHITEK